MAKDKKVEEKAPEVKSSGGCISIEMKKLKKPKFGMSLKVEKGIKKI